MAALTSEKEDIFDQIHADNTVKRRGAHIYRKKYKKDIWRSILKIKNLPPPLCRHRFTNVHYVIYVHSYPSRDLVLLNYEELENLCKIPKQTFLLKADGHKKIFRSDSIRS